MADNPYVNKVKYFGQTIMDLSNDTVTPSDVLDGVTFHDRSGAPQQGNMITHDVYDGLDSSSSSDALSANQGKILADKIAPYEKLETSWAAAFETQPTLSNGTHYQGGCRYRKFGIFVHIFISVQFTSAPTNKTLFTLPAGFRPIANVPIVCIGGENYNNKAECIIYSDGTVRCSSVDKYVIGSGLFIVST